MSWMPVILLAIWVTSWTFIGALMGALRVRSVPRAKQKYGRFLLIACTSYYVVLPAAFAVVYVVGRVQPIDNGHICMMVALVICSAPFFSLFLMRRANQLLDPDPKYCGACGYDMRGSPSGVCPECGRDQTA